MRTGGCTVQQSLTAEAATIVKQAVSLARRRGHSHVTPLHVASSMLASSSGLLKKACLQAHSHPLQCKALELCFNVALNRLPTSASSPLLGPHSHLPSLSNALVAAFKRAQAHQRRGSIENQQSPILALKIELEQLVISILDDPSVSRVMREAGFSSPQVKTNVEQAISSDISSKSPPTQIKERVESNRNLAFSTNVTQFPFMRVSKPTNQSAQNDDVMTVLDTMMGKKRKNTVIIAESLTTAEGVVKGLVDKFDRGEVSGELRFVQFISVPLLSLRNLSREEVEHKLGELRCLVKSHVARGVVLYLDDLHWICEFRSRYVQQRRGFYCPVEHMVMELSRMVSGIGESGKLWLMGIANFQTYMRCKTGHPSLETLWVLHPLALPVGSLGLSLNLESDSKDQFRSKVLGEGSVWFEKTGIEKHLTCCADCLANFKREAHSITRRTNIKEYSTTTSTSLPSWLQQYKDESKRHIQNITDQESEKIRDLCKKWNSVCSSVHKKPHFLEKGLNVSLLSSPSSSSSVSSYELRSPKLHQFLLPENEAARFEPNLGTYIPVSKPDLLSNPNSSPNSASCSEVSEDMECQGSRFKELNSENLKSLCDALERKIPWHGDIIPDIVSTILGCRSGMIKRSKNKLKQREEKQETWLFFLGADNEGKEKIAREIAKNIFGSQTRFVNLGLSIFSSTTRADSTEETSSSSSKRARDEHGRSYLERFADAVQENPSRLFFMEDLEQVDYCSQMGIKKAIESGRIAVSGGDSVPLKDAIVIFSSETFSSVSRACSPHSRRPKCMDNKAEITESSKNLEANKASTSVLDLNLATDEDVDQDSVSDIGILESVDRQVMFKIRVL